MTALAGTFHASIRTGLLDKGAQKVVVLNILAITNPPRFQLVLDSIGADWWKRYCFADGLHPTPYGHQLAFKLIAKSLAIGGWL